MTLAANSNYLSHVVAVDRAHVWHHLSQHKAYETNDPRVFVEGKGLRLWDAKGNEWFILNFCDLAAAFLPSSVLGRRDRTLLASAS